MGKKVKKTPLRRFDILLPHEIVTKIERWGERDAIPPRTLARSLLVKKVRELEKREEGDGNGRY